MRPGSTCHPRSSGSMSAWDFSTGQLRLSRGREGCLEKASPQHSQCEEEVLSACIGRSRESRAPQSLPGWLAVPFLETVRRAEQLTRADFSRQQVCVTHGNITMALIPQIPGLSGSWSVPLTRCSPQAHYCLKYNPDHMIAHDNQMQCPYFGKSKFTSNELTTQSAYYVKSCLC